MDSQVIKVIVVDDMPEVRFILKNQLKSTGFEVLFGAINGRDMSLKLEAAHELPQICIMDIDMPEINGYESAKILRKKWPQVKILAHSGNENNDALVKMLQCGADGYLVKGSKPEELRYALLCLTTLGYYFNDWTCRQLMNYVRKTG